jgi:hypothetical protein
MQLSAWAKEQELAYSTATMRVNLALPKTIAFMEQEVEKLNP